MNDVPYEYEEGKFPIATPDPIEAIRFRMDQAGLTSADRHPYMPEVLVHETQAPYSASPKKSRKKKAAA